MDDATDPRAAVLQEAIDCIVGEFGYPDALDVSVRSRDGRRETVVEVRRGDDERVYELRFDGCDEESEPTLSRLAT